MPTILLKKSDTASAVPSTANLTNLAGGAEVAVNTADKRMFTMNSSSAVVELGTNPSSLTCADASFTVARVGSLTISSLSLTNATFASATITNLTSTSATISSALTLTGGTANGVLYLNGSKVATSGSALTFDGTSLAVTSSAPEFTVFETASGNNNRLIISQSGIQTIYNSTFSAGSGQHLWQLGGSEQMRLTSTGLGIGTSSPATKLDVNGDVTQRNGSGTIIGNIQNSSGWYDFKASANVNGAQISTAAATPIRFLPNGVEAARFDSSGNLALGVTPSAWSQGKSFEVFQAGYGVWNGGASSYLLANAYFNSGFKYANTGSQASHYYQFEGAHVWSTAASGTAGNAISFTQAMTLDASGNLGVGTTSPSAKLVVSNAGAQGFEFNPNASGLAQLEIYNRSTAAYYSFRINADDIRFHTGASATERARITSTGNLLVGTTTDVSGLSGVISDIAGNVRNIPSAGAAKTSAYTLTITDIGEFVTVGTSGSITVPNDTFTAGNAISIYNDTTGNISINCPITTAYLAGTNTDRASLTLSTRGIATILFINPSLCVASGNLT
jgi:hypothetical protein